MYQGTMIPEKQDDPMMHRLLRALAFVRELLLALILTLAALLCGLAAFPFLGPRQPFVFFYFSILLSARFCSLPVSLLSTAAGGVLGNFFFIEPRFGFLFDGPDDYAGLISFALTACVLCFTMDGLRRRARPAENRFLEGPGEWS